MGWVIGTSGYLGTRREKWKSYKFDFLELNSSFYRLPTPATIESLKALSVRIVTKVPRWITHQKRLRGVEGDLRLFRESVQGIGKKWIGCLVQLPPSFRMTEENVRRVKALKCPGLGKIFIEFRDKSWLCDRAYKIVRSKGWTFVGTYVQGRLGTMPPGLFLPPAGKLGYVRVHGRGVLDRTTVADLLNAVRVYGTAFVAFNNYSYGRSRPAACRGIKSSGVCDAKMALECARVLPSSRRKRSHRRKSLRRMRSG